MSNGFQDGIKVSYFSIGGNVFLSIFKLIAGIIGKSHAMISDSVHSLSDVFSTIIVIIGLKISNKKEDKSHPYGHERIECVASLLLAVLLFITGAMIGFSGLKIIIWGSQSEISSPTLIALVAAIVSILTKEIMYWWTRRVAYKLNSSSLMADAWHHRSDALSSIGSLIGIGGAMLGFKLLDPIASIVICLCVMGVSINIFIDAMNKMVDKSCSDEFVDNLRTLILDVDGVINIDSIKTRLFGSRVYVDLEISTDGDISLSDAHEIADNVHDVVEANNRCIKHCMVHVNPVKV